MWHKTNYPEAMKKLPEEVRNKAIVIANARLEDGMDPNHRTLIITSIRLAEAAVKNKKKKEEPKSNAKTAKKKVKATVKQVKATAKKKVKATAKKAVKATAQKKVKAAKKNVKAIVKSKSPKTTKKHPVEVILPRGEDMHLIPSHPKVIPDANMINKDVQQLYNHQEEIALHREQQRAKQVLSLRGKRGFFNPRQS